MAALIPLFALLASTAGVTQSPIDIDRWRPLVEEASTRFGVPSAWVERVLGVESGGRTTRHGIPIRSRVGAIGLMQLMPATWAEIRASLQLGDDPDDPRDNILAGTFYLRQMYDRFGYPGMFAAYNAGPARYRRHLTEGAPLSVETRAYLGEIEGVPRQARSSVTLFAIAPMAFTDAVQPQTLFVNLKDPLDHW